MSDEGRIQLPDRSTRGKRMRAQLDDEEAEADADFWNQEFFAEDARDADYASEKEEEDVLDSDFFESESEEDGDGEVEVKERKKKSLKPPGAPPGGSRPRPKPAVHRAPANSTPTVAAAAADDTAAAAAAGAVFDELPQSVIFEATYEAPTLRKSTRTRVEEAQKERVQREQQAKATKRPQRQGDFRVMTQEELLAEAMHTELDNLASLQKLLAREEETKKKANMKKQRFGGPLIRYRSRTIQVLVPPEVAARQQLQQQAAGAGQTAAAESTHGSEGSQLGAAAQTTPAAVPQDSSAPASAMPGDVQNKMNGHQASPQQQQDQQPVEASQPRDPVLQKQAFDTLQCLGMKIPRWLLPQRAAGAVSKPICPITGTAAQYRDPLTGYYYGSAEAFRELRKRMGQPLPPPQSYAQLAVSPAAELQTLLAAAAPLPGVTAGAGEAQPAAADTSEQQSTGLTHLPAGHQQLQQIIQHQVLQQMATAGSKGRGRNQGMYPQQQQQQPVPDEVAALVLQVSQSVHG